MIFIVMSLTSHKVFNNVFPLFREKLIAFKKNPKSKERDKSNGIYLVFGNYSLLFVSSAWIGGPSIARKEEEMSVT